MQLDFSLFHTEILGPCALPYAFEFQLLTNRRELVEFVKCMPRRSGQICMTSNVGLHSRRGVEALLLPVMGEGQPVNHFQPTQYKKPARISSLSLP